MEAEVGRLGLGGGDDGSSSRKVGNCLDRASFWRCGTKTSVDHWDKDPTR
jgi:hypothetical protein